MDLAWPARSPANEIQREATMFHFTRTADIGRTITSLFAAVLMSTVFVAGAVIPAERGVAVERTYRA